MRSVRITVVAVALVTASGLVIVPPSARAESSSQAGTARHTPSTTVLSTAVAAPFNLSVGNGRILLADGGTNQIGRITAKGGVKTVVAGVEGASGIASAHHGRWLAYTTTTTESDFTNVASGLVIRKPNGRTVLGDTLAYEKKRNPDGKISYGVTNPSQCVRDTFAKAGFPVSYTGEIDSHAYSVAAVGGHWVVADAGANALLRVSNSGKVSTLAVLPAQRATITADFASTYGLDDCVVGIDYGFESVPTDVEVGPDGFLYVTTLPGGTEDASLGARGSVYRVNPRTGHYKRVATGFLGATNLAISGGRIYVTELFAGRVSRVSHGKPTAFLDLPGALAIEAGPRGVLYVATGITGDPSVIRVGIKARH